MGRKVDVDDLIDTAAVAEIIGLNNPNGVSVYQKRYEDFPEPVISRGICRLWLEAEVVGWANQRSGS